ncbi:MAG: hypothetical protein ABIT71_18780 [Vicinamibacteraceae bacterium]
MRRATTHGGACAPVVAALLIVASVASARAADVRCDYGSAIECTASGCAATPVAGAHLVLPDAATLVAATRRASDAASLPSIQVCDATACSPIRVRVARSGAFANIAQEGGAHFVKVAMVDVPPGIHAGDFLEVAARFLTTVTYVGSCPALVRPTGGK